MLLRKRKDWKYGKDNYNNIISNMLELNIDTMETITVTYKIKDMIDKSKEIIYCIAYVEVDPDGQKYRAYFENAKYEFLNSSSDLFFRGIFPTGSSISKDGEYRSGYVNWDVICIQLRNDPPLQEIYDKIYEYLVKNMKDRKYFLTIEHFYPTDKIKNEHQFELEAITLDSKIKFFCISWFTFYFNFHYATIPGHLNDTYVSLLLKYQTQDYSFFKSLVDKAGFPAIFRILWIFNNYTPPNMKPDYTQKYKFGQKIVPLNLLEAQNPFNISYAVWKEYFIAKKASELVVNGLTPGFALFGGWLFIKTEDRYVFDNQEHISRLERSKIAEKITDILIQAQTYTYMHIDSDKKEVDKENTSWLSAEFKKLYYMIRSSINHTKNTVIMSNVAICFITEYTGRTLYNSTELSKKSKHFQKYMMNMIADTHYETFRRYLFEICYNLFLLHDKLHVIHGDLHLNNILLNLVTYIHSVPDFDSSNRKIVYAIGDKFYMFAFNFYYASLIDFSRSIVKYDNADILRDPEIPMVFPFIGDKEEFRQSQVMALLNFLIGQKPVFTERRHQLHDYINDHYDDCFDLLTALDLYNFLQKLFEFITSKEAKGASPRIIKLIEDMYLFIDSYLSNQLQDVLEGIENERQLPVTILINEFFATDLVDDSKINAEMENICDFYDSELPLKYNLDDKLPPGARLSKSALERHQKAAQKNIENFKIVNLIMQRQRDKHP